MIALQPFTGKIGKLPFAVMKGREIPDHILNTLDIEDMKKKKIIGEEGKAVEQKSAASEQKKDKE